MRFIGSFPAPYLHGPTETYRHRTLSPPPSSSTEKPLACSKTTA